MWNDSKSLFGHTVLRQLKTDPGGLGRLISVQLAVQFR